MYPKAYPMILVVVTTAVAACSGDPCEQAVEHLQSCFPDKSINAQQALASCDAGQAELITAQSCESLASGGKSDGWWDWWGGGSGGSGGSSDATLVVKLTECGKNIFGDVDCSIDYGGLPCAEVIVEDDNGSEVARGFTEGNRFTVNDLDEGTSYTVRVLRTDGSPAQMIDGGSEQNAEQTVQLDGETEAHFYFAPTERQNVVGCTIRIDGQVDGSCDGATLDVDETEWTWFVELESLDDGQKMITRPMAIWQESTATQINRFTFLNVRPGEYRLSIHEMDISSYNRRNNPDYERLLRWDVKHKNVYQETITVSDTQQLPLISLECR